MRTADGCHHVSHMMMQILAPARDIDFVLQAFFTMLLVVRDPDRPLSRTQKPSGTAIPFDGEFR
jgi:hypothetical protein